MHPKQLIISILAGLILIVISCGGSSNANPNLPPGDPSDKFGFAASDFPRDQNPLVPGPNLEELVTGNTEFAFDLYKQLMVEDGNLFFSPFSISQALAMTIAGTRENTEVQIADVMHFTLEQEDLHPAFNKLDLELHSRAESPTHGGDPVQLNIANSTWGQEGWTWQTPFLDIMAVNYGAGMRMVDFMAKPDECRIVINDWVEDRTEEKIKDLLPPGIIGSDTRLVLVNAIYFNASWRFPFMVENTYPGDFYLFDGSPVTANMMVETEDHGYMAGDGYKACEMLYDGEELSMTVILPDSGRFDEIESSLDAQFVNGITANMNTRSVILWFPKFEYESEFSLTQTLQNMGMTDAFTGGLADFSGMDGTRLLYITDVVHKAFVAVDEEGTEAAAATAVIIGYVSMPESVEFNVNRPFIFFIRDIPTGAILFIGRVVNPV